MRTRSANTRIAPILWGNGAIYRHAWRYPLSGGLEDRRGRPSRSVCMAGDCASVPHRASALVQGVAEKRRVADKSVYWIAPTG